MRLGKYRISSPRIFARNQVHDIKYFHSTHRDHTHFIVVAQQPTWRTHAGIARAPLLIIDDCNVGGWSLQVTFYRAGSSSRRDVVSLVIPGCRYRYCSDACRAQRRGEMRNGTPIGAICGPRADIGDSTRVNSTLTESRVKDYALGKRSRRNLSGRHWNLAASAPEPYSPPCPLLNASCEVRGILPVLATLCANIYLRDC